LTADQAFLVDWAAWAGRHALLLFFLMLALLQMATRVCWWALRRDTAFGLAPTHFLRLRIAIGMGVLLFAASTFAELAGHLTKGGALGPADLALTEALSLSVPRPALLVFAAVTRLADTTTLTGLCIGIAMALIAVGRRWLALGWVVAIAGNGLLNQALKAIFGRSRPLQPEGFVVEQGFSFPSGHSSGAIVTYGMLAYLAVRILPVRWHLPAVATAMAVAFTVGASRIFLQVHFASDVVAGFASGTAWLALCVMTIELARWCRKRSSGTPVTWE
jgi:undecaprenyl-diphosphatase